MPIIHQDKDKRTSDMEVPSPAHKDTENMLVYNITSSSYNYHLFHALFGTRIHYHRKLFDITAAFDTVDHELLISQLERQFGLRGIVLAWFQSYMSGRTFRVVFSGCTSSIVYIVCSVPQGSVLDPLWFIVYTADLAACRYREEARRTSLSLHVFTAVSTLSSHRHGVSCC